MKCGTNTCHLLLALFSVVLISCSGDDSGSDNNNPKPDQVKKSEVVQTYAALVYKNYQDALGTAEALQAAIDDFVSQPDENRFEAAKNAWKSAREPYGQTEAFRFSNGPIDDSDGPEGLLNAWPLDENYIDYVEGAESSGIINDPVSYPSIDKATLEGLNEAGGESNISVGYHAIEFLLWGQDNTAPSDKIPGQRPYTDFVDGGTAANQDRRRDYLAVCAALLVEHLQQMVDEWAPGGNYRTTFLGLNSDTALKNILTGIATLSKSELAGERIFVAYDNQDQEDEHSCFSDNTHRDVRLNLDGIANVYRGAYSSVSGPSLEDLFMEQDATLGAEISAQLAAAEASVDATAIPFDFAVSDGTERPKVLEAVNALRSLGDKLVEGGASLGITVSSE